MLKERIKNVLRYVLFGCNNETFHENYYLDKSTNQFLPEEEFAEMLGSPNGECQYSFMINKDVVNSELKQFEFVDDETLDHIAERLVE